MKALYDQISLSTSQNITKTYSTSFSLGILALSSSIRDAIYSIYGYVRLADEIVDSFHDYDKNTLLEQLERDTWQSIHTGISINPIIHTFQDVVNKYKIDHILIAQFLKSMFMDLSKITYDDDKYKEYILGSAEVVGLMCLKVFVNGDQEVYEKLKPYAMRLGAAFQKINFLRDIKDDYFTLGRTYFPNVNMQLFNDETKYAIESDIEADFKEALIGIKMLPSSSRFGVYLAYKYYWSLFKKIRKLPSHRILNERIRVPNTEKISLMMTSYVHYKFALI